MWHVQGQSVGGEMTNVIAFKAVDRARDRKRRVALTAIVPRIYQLIERYGEADEASDGRPLKRAWYNEFCLTLTRTKSNGTFFCVYDTQTNNAVLTGFLDPLTPGRYLGGSVEVLTWQRGWERRLFQRGAGMD